MLIPQRPKHGRRDKMPSACETRHPTQSNKHVVAELSTVTSSVHSVAQEVEKRRRAIAKGDMYAASIQRRLEKRDDWMRAQCVCSVAGCGKKALYYIEKKMWCRDHVTIGKQMYAKRTTPQLAARGSR